MRIWKSHFLRLDTPGIIASLAIRDVAAYILRTDRVLLGHQVDVE